MVQTRPRFGGGTNMENQTTKHVFLPGESGKETPPASTMDPRLEIEFENIGQQLSSEDHFKIEDARAKDHEIEGERPTVHQNQQRGDTEMGKYYTPKPEHLTQAPGRQHMPDGQDFEFGNCTCVASPEGCPLKENENNCGSGSKESLLLDPASDVSCQHLYKSRPNKEDIDRLLCLLESLGINVTVQEYTRTAMESQGGTDDRKSRANNADNCRHIDLSSASLNSKKSAAVCDTRKKEYFPGDVLYCKNLFLKDRKANYYLVIAEESARVDLKQLKQQLHVARNLSFADANATKQILGQKSGAINPFAAMLESARDVRFILHQSLLEAKVSKTPLAFHPLDGSLQVDITVDELAVFLHHNGHRLELLSAIMDTGKCLDQHVPENLLSASEMEINTKQTEPMLMKEKEIVVADDFDKRGHKVFSDSTVGKINLTHTEHDNSVGFQTNAGTSKDGVSSSSISETIDNHKTRQVKKQPILKTYTRKGKLKSFLKKTNNTRGEPDNGKTNIDASVEDLDEKESKSRASAPSRTPQYMDDKDDENISATTPDEPDESKQEQHVDKVESSSPILPEIIEFYDRLSDLGILYHDVCLQTSTTRDMGPSLGCKCFFLKDRSPKFYLIITHEYYELDYGRLKQALKPRKKLDQTEPADILDSLGVQPFRVTPFSCTTVRAVRKNIKVFITEKIRHPEIVLCIQHPFADGRRLVMKSGDLQRYLSLYVTEIKTVSEKSWPDRFNWLFTRFTDQLNKSMRPHLAASTQKEAPSDIITSDISESEEQLHVNQMKNANNGMPVTDNYRNGFMFSSNPLLLDVCQRMSRNVFDVMGTISSREVKDEKKNSDVYGVDCSFPGFEGSRVDPALDERLDETHCKSQSVSQDDKLDIAPSFATRKEEETSVAQDVKKVEKNFDTTTFGQRSSSFKINTDLNDQAILFSVENILDHLRETSIEFSFTKESENVEDKSVPKITLHQDQQKRRLKEEVVDNVETCSTSYLRDDNDNHYILVGGESDFITIRRFTRIFHLPGRLQMCELNDIGEFTITPFSIVQTLRKRIRPNMGAKIYVILFTSLYIDPDTTCLFYLDQTGSMVRLTSSELENYISKIGMEVWYIP